MAPAPGIHPSLAPASVRRVERHRLDLGGGATTTVHVVRMPRDRTQVRVVALPRPEPLLAWCRREAVSDAMVGGFFVRPEGMPLGEVRIGGRAVESRPFEAPWYATRACIHANRGRLVLAPRDQLPASPTGDLLQAGPLLCRGARNLIELSSDPEGFSAGSADFDSDITDGRYPRAALGISRDEILAIVCDGRDTAEAGLSMSELADCLVGLGAETAINLDGGGSTSLVGAGVLLNMPREDHGIVLDGGRAISTALVFSRVSR